MQWSPRRFASGAPGPGSFVEAGARRGGWGGAGLGGAGAGVLVTSGAGRGRAACRVRVPRSLVSFARIQSVSMEVSQVEPRCTLKCTASLLAKGPRDRAPCARGAARACARGAPRRPRRGPRAAAGAARPVFSPFSDFALRDGGCWPGARGCMIDGLTTYFTRRSLSRLGRCPPPPAPPRGVCARAIVACDCDR